MFVMKRNQVILTALVLMIAVAGYLNFTESRVDEAVAENTEELFFLSDGDITTLADDAEPAAEASAEGEESLDPITAQVANGVDDTGAAIFVSAEASAPSSGSAYFVQAKLEREQARSKQKEMLTEIINNDKLDKSQKTESANEMLELQKRIEKESAAESMIESKGFSNAYVRMDDETVDVVVDKESLTEAELAQIMDIVKRKTGMPESAIRISTLKK